MKTLINIFKTKYLFSLTGIVIFIFYLQTIAPSVVETDCGELATVQATLGIAHPTGYPLFTLLGYVWLKIPFLFSVIFKLNLLATIYTILASIIFLKTGWLLLNNFNLLTISSDTKSQKASQTNNFAQLDEKTKFISVISAGLMLAFSSTFWIQSTSTEVYSLHLLLLNLILYSFLIAYFSTKENDFRKSQRQWIVFFNSAWIWILKSPLYHLLDTSLSISIF